MTWPKSVSFDGRWDHFPETVGRGGRLCATCRYATRMVEFVGIGQVRRTKDYSCELEPNQIRRVKDVIECEAYEPKPHTIRQMNLDRWVVA